MAKKHLKLDPIDLDATSWMYEEPEGLAIYSKGQRLLVPIRAIRSYLKRKDK